jgi:hypothetical protein
MKTLNKLFLLTVLGMGVYVHETHASSIQNEIRNMVHQHKHEIDGIKNSNQLNNLLAKLKIEILQVLSDESKLDNREKSLKLALEALNPTDKMSIATHIKAILSCLDADIANIIKNAIPQVYRTILAI